VNDRLDYLVIGSIAAIGWKHGSYGRKIEKAREIASPPSARLKLVPEATFMDSLALVPPTNSGAIDAKVFVCNYKFLVADEHSFDADRLEHSLRYFQETHECHVTARAHWALMDRELFDEEADASHDAMLVVQCRIVKQLPLDARPTELIEIITRGFESVPGVDGSLSWFERAEGSADYIRLLREVPQHLRIPSL
jgi:hypothetical protein